MKLFFAMGAVIALSFATVASATTWTFGSSPTTIADNTAYSTALGTITVFGEQITNSVSGGTYLSAGDSTLSGLFSTDAASFNEGTGIAPYNPLEGTANMSTEDGITDEVTTSVDGGKNSTATNSAIGNILVLELGSNIAKNTTLSFLLEAGNGQGPSDAVTLYYSDTAGGGTYGQNLSPSTMTNFGTTPAGSITNTGTVPQFTSFVKNTAGIEYIAIEADCHYLLLDTITGTPPSGVPEPRFYGILLAGLLGLAGIAYQRRRAAQVNA